MLSLLDKILSLGGLFKNGKTNTALVSLLLWYVARFKPEFLPALQELLRMVGLGLLSVGVAHKVIKFELGK